MKLYATITSERKSRPAKKGGNEYINIHVADGNDPLYQIVVEDMGDELAPAITVYQWEKLIFQNRD